MKITLSLILICLALCFVSAAFAQTPAETSSKECAGYREANREMDQIYREVLGKRKSEAAFTVALQNEQRIWTTYRGAQLKTAFALKPDETIKGRYDEYYLTCRCEHLERLTIERLKVLQSMLSDANSLDDGNICGTNSTQTAQTQIVDFDDFGRVRISAVETLTEPLELVFSDVVTGRELAAFEFQQPGNEESYRPNNFHSPVSPLLRFKTIQIQDLPAPLVLGVAVNPGGSDHGFMVQVFGEDGNKKIKVYTSEPLNTAIVGGVHIGDLGAGRGLGMAVWNYIWDDNEAHSSPHIFEVQLYPYDKNKKVFVKGEKLRTKNKYDSERAALDELKLSFFVDQLNLVSGIESYREKW